MEQILKIYIRDAYNFYANDNVVSLYRLLLSEMNQFPELFELAFGTQGRITKTLADFFTMAAEQQHIKTDGCYMLACQILDLVRGLTLWAKLTKNPNKEQFFIDADKTLQQVHCSIMLLVNNYFQEKKNAE